MTGPDLATLTGTALGTFAKLESVARGFQDGLKLLSLTLLGLGLPLATLRLVTPPRQERISDPIPVTELTRVLQRILARFWRSRRSSLFP